MKDAVDMADFAMQIKSLQKTQDDTPSVKIVDNSSVASPTTTATATTTSTLTRPRCMSSMSFAPRPTTLRALFHTEANCRFIYANPDGYAAVDGGSKGGYLIQAIKHVFMKKNEIENQSLDNIINQIRLKTRQLVGTGVMQNVEDVNHMNFNVYFKKCQEK